NLVHRGLPCIVPPRAGPGEVRARRLVRQQHIDTRELPPRLPVFPDEMPPLVGQLGRLRRTLARVRQRRCRLVVPRRRERAAEASDPDAAALPGPPLGPEVLVYG